MTNARTAKSAREKAAELRAEAARQQARRRNTLVAASVAAVIVVVVGVVVLFQTLSHQQDAKIAAAAAPPANLVDGGILVGNSTAKVTIELYEDFQCPACDQFEKANATQLAAWAKDGTAKLVYRPIAFLDQQSSTRYSTRSLNAVAAVVNSTPSAFQKFHDLLYANQPAEGGVGLPDSQLIELAVQAGAKEADIKQPVTDLKYAGWVLKTTEDAQTKKQVNSTPTIFVNGTKVDDWSPAKLKDVVDKAAKAAG